MAYLYGLIAALFLAPVAGFAQTTTTPESPVTQYNGNYTNPAYTASGPAACSGWMGYNNALPWGSGAGFKSATVTSITHAGGTSCTYYYVGQTGNAGGPSTGVVLQTRSWCVGGDKAPVGGVCEPFTPAGDCAAMNGKTQDFSFTVDYANRDGYETPTNVCEDQWGSGATRSSGGPIPFCGLVKQPGFGLSVCYGGTCKKSSTYKYTGSTCVPAPGGAGTTPSTAPSTGEPAPAPGSDPTMCTGTFNGVPVVHKCAEVTETAVKTVTPTTSTTTTSTVAGTPEGTKTSTTISCSGEGSCTKTVSTTTTNSSGQSTTVTATTGGDKASLCEGTSGLKSCAGAAGTGGDGEGEKSAFAGACTTGFACTGDAAICAVAKASNETKCLLDASTATEKEVYATAVAAGTATGIVTATTELSASSFDQTNALGTAASCIPDQAITVSGVSISVPFSSVCPHLAVLGNLMLAISFLSAMVIVGRPT